MTPTSIAGPLLERPPSRAVVETSRGWWQRIRGRWSRADALVALTFLSLAVFVLNRQWRNLDNGYLVKSGQDQTMWEWFFAVAAHSVAHFENPLGTTLQNQPLGVNMMANTAMFSVSIPFAPVTLLFGPTATFVTVLTLGLAGTAFAWYWLLSRYVVDSRLAAAVGGLVCGFAPAMISHANAHPNFVCLFLFPLIIAAILRLSSDGRWVRDGLILGFLLAVQIGLGEEPLLIFAFAFPLFALVYALHAPRDGLARLATMVRPLAVAAVTAFALTAVALWYQFFGPQSYGAVDHSRSSNDVKSLFQFPSESLGGWFAPGENVAINPTEQNAYLGWPLLGVVAIVAVWLWRDRLARAATVTLLAMIVLSLGSELIIGGEHTGITMPWQYVAHLPLVESLLETRFVMAAIPAIAIMLALATERALRSRGTQVLWFGALLIAFVPLAPTPLPIVDRGDTPDFFVDGAWRSYVGDGSVVVVPLPNPQDARALRWQGDSDFGFSIAGGYFVGPTGKGHNKGNYGPLPRPTADLLAKVGRSGSVPPIDGATRAAAADDLRFWRADVVVLPHTQNQDAIRLTIQQLLGDPGRSVDDVWIWDVRPHQPS